MFERLHAARSQAQSALDVAELTARKRALDVVMGRRRIRRFVCVCAP